MRRDRKRRTTRSILKRPLIRPRLRSGHLLPRGEKGRGGGDIPARFAYAKIGQDQGEAASASFGGGFSMVATPGSDW